MKIIIAVSLFELSIGSRFFDISIIDINQRSLFGIFYNWKHKNLMINLLFVRIYYYKGWAIK